MADKNYNSAARLNIKSRQNIWWLDLLPKQDREGREATVLLSPLPASWNSFEGVIFQISDATLNIFLGLSRDG